MKKEFKNIDVRLLTVAEDVLTASVGEGTGPRPGVAQTATRIVSGVPSATMLPNND